MLIAVIIVSIVPLVIADRINPGVYPLDSKPYGLGYRDLSAKWWQWVLPIPSDVNPMNDPTGKNCNQNQKGPVWYLAGTGAGPTVRECTIPAGKSIFSPIYVTECSFAEYPQLKTLAALHSCAVNLNQGTTLLVSVDGKNLQMLDSYRASSLPFGFTFPVKNVFGAPRGPTQAVSDGWFIFLEPLKPGNHVIHQVGSNIGNPTTGTQSYINDVTFHLLVK
jgi:hypothetical protein